MKQRIAGNRRHIFDSLLANLLANLSSVSVYITSASLQIRKFAVPSMCTSRETYRATSQRVAVGRKKKMLTLKFYYNKHHKSGKATDKRVTKGT